MVHAGLDPVLGCAVAGVKSIDWFIGYMRANLSDKIRASLAIGPFKSDSAYQALRHYFLPHLRWRVFMSCEY